MSIYNSKNFIKEIRNNPENFYIIHYSCESLNDDNITLSPRITSIAIIHYATKQAVSFSTHSIADELNISREDVKLRFDEIEKKLLQNFYSFISDRRDKFWIHWNMKNITYGFEHLAHRYITLSGENIPIIPVERRLNLDDLLADRYGEGYVKDPRMQSLMNLNGGISKKFLKGDEEVQAFKNNKFIEMHNSTLSKVEFFYWTIRKFVNGKIRTDSYGFGVMLDRLFESRLAKAIGLSSAILAIASILRKLLALVAFNIEQ